jgi:dihydroorotase
VETGERLTEESFERYRKRGGTVIAHEGFVPALERKGRIRVGADADLTVFDPATVIDRATFEDSHRASDGIPFVPVEGTFVVRDGALVDGALPGRGIRR